MGTYDFLSPGEVDIIETAKAGKKQEKERKELAEAKKELKPKKFSFSKTLNTKKTSKKKKANPFKKQKVFVGKPDLQDYTKEQKILFGMFGGGERVLTNMDGRSLPRIDNTLNSGGGIIKSGDVNHETMKLFQGGLALPFFGGGRR